MRGRQLLEDPSAAQEGKLPNRPWTSDKIGEDLSAKMLEQIRGFRVEIDLLEAKGKQSQNRNPRRHNKAPPS